MALLEIVGAVVMTVFAIANLAMWVAGVGGSPTFAMEMNAIGTVSKTVGKNSISSFRNNINP